MKVKRKTIPKKPKVKYELTLSEEEMKIVTKALGKFTWIEVQAAKLDNAKVQRMYMKFMRKMTP